MIKTSLFSYQKNIPLSFRVTFYNEAFSMKKKVTHLPKDELMKTDYFKLIKKSTILIWHLA